MLNACDFGESWVKNDGSLASVQWKNPHQCKKKPSLFMINWINLSLLSNYPTWQWQVTCISMVFTVKSLSRLIARGYQGCKGPGPWMLTEACQSCIESQIGKGVDPPSERTHRGWDPSVFYWELWEWPKNIRGEIFEWNLLRGSWIKGR